MDKVVEEKPCLLEPLLENAKVSSITSRHISLKQVDVENHPAYLEFLSKFTTGNSAESFQGHTHWQSALQMHPSDAINSLITGGFLEKSNLATALTCRCGATQLKSLAKEIGVSSSGRKDQIAERLAKANSDVVKNLAVGFEVFSCTEKGLAAVRGFQERAKNAKSQAETLAVEALRSKQFKEACRVIASYEAAQVSPRGLGIDWKDYDDRHDVGILRIIFETKPERFASISDIQLQEVRVAAGMLQLWGVNDASRWLVHSKADEFGMEPDDAAMLLLNYGLNMKRLAEFQLLGIKKVQILGGCDECPACQEIKQKFFPLVDVPEVPLANCTCETGCTCTITAVP